MRSIAQMGGRKAHVVGTAHEFTSDEARAAGRKGGLAAHAGRHVHSFGTSATRAEPHCVVCGVAYYPASAAPAKLGVGR